MEPKHLELLLPYANKLKEVGNNQGFNDKDFEAKIKKVGWYKGAYYCAFGVKVGLVEAGVKLPKKLQGLARDYYNLSKNKISITDVLAGNYKELIAVGDLVVWQKGDTNTGHIGIVVELYDNYKMLVLEFNTSPDDKKSQDNGDGCYLKVRTIGRGTLGFHIYGFAKIEF